ncbi:Hypothetical protein NGAL_HAMBI2605_59390 [Neorhizobium galegae bv. orientalis]|nr:Hypothetical protein NGAL_HAMBI2605_59390 [Neorhizobium galegae bv. orientalis]
MFRVVENVRQKHLDWVHSILSSKGWTPHRLAKEAGLSPSALTKFLNDTTGTRTLNSYSVEKITEGSGMPMGMGAGAVFNEPQSSRFELERLDDTSINIDALRQGKNGIDTWTVRTRALELAGYIPGDLVVVDQNTSPQRGDVVVAQVYDRNGEAETVMRIYETSFLIAASMDPAHLVPILINKDVVIRGVVVSSFRSRRAA